MFFKTCLRQRNLCVYWKFLLLFSLVIQNASLVLVMHHVRVSVPTFLPQSGVFVIEVIKLLASLVFLFFNTKEWQEFIKAVSSGITQSSKICFMTSVPALMYAIQNNLQLAAISHTSALVFSATSQLKLPATAMFAYILLGRRPKLLQLMALVILLAGVCIAQLCTVPPRSRHNQLDRNPLFALIATVIASLLSGLACVYVEMVFQLSQNPLGIWIHNIRMSLFGALLALFMMCVHSDGNTVAISLFSGLTGASWVMIMLHALGGLLVAATLSKTGSVMKNSTTVFSIWLMWLMSYPISGFHLEWQFFVSSALLTIGAIFFLVFN